MQDPSPSKVVADLSQIEQIVLNLVVNPRDALPTGGQITIEIQNVKVDQHCATQQSDVAVGSYVFLAVTDNGVAWMPWRRSGSLSRSSLL